MAGKVADQIGYLVASLNWHFDAQLKASAGAASLPVEQARVLALLHEQNGRAMSDLAQNALVEAPTLTKIIDRMVAESLVYRVPDIHDRRRVLIFLSDRGKSRFEALMPAVDAQEQLLTKRLGKAGVAALKKLSQELGRLEAAKSPAPLAPALCEHDRSVSA
jgi:MarR family transcriptional regulator, organic hydroperoxide resistance regulator